MCCDKRLWALQAQEHNASLSATTWQGHLLVLQTLCGEALSLGQDATAHNVMAAGAE
jgi:hypothetical protein